jgi:phosphoribosylamine-glycine ligase
VTLVGRGPDLGHAREAAYGAVAGVELEGGRWRTDIAARELDLGDGAQLDHHAG